MKQLIFIICGLCAISNYAQNDIGSISATFDLSQVAMLDLEPNNSTVTLNLAANEAGEKVTMVTANNKKWINFSSAVTSAAAPRSISIVIADGQVPSGIYLKLSTSNKMGIGQGVLGTPSGILTLTSTSQNIVTGIRGAFTGDGIGNGYELTYYLEIYDYKLLDFNQSATLSITLTLSDL
ncbi:MAG: hypothetical protein CVU08_01155 [Bacteroidetes bacterium HGW-Bacteroidetes-3]|nr:MAG: hypothetical protein CVU08_01155 [Bacteroidetes bacterium HGW-Bacteroidetes-3]